MTLTPAWRKAVLTVHVVTSVGWLGSDLVLLTLGIAGRSGADAAVVYPAMGLIGLVLFLPLGVVVWLIGVFNAWTRGLDAGAALPGRRRLDLLIASIVSSTLLVLATTISVYKPWGCTRS